MTLPTHNTTADAGVLERFQPERIRDDMIDVARALSNRDCGAMQSEMRTAQIAFMATTLADYRELVTADLLEALTEAREFIQPFNRAEALYDKIDAAIAKATNK